MSKQTVGFNTKAAISLLGTPWLLLISTAIPLYLKNQGELYYRYEVLYPFLASVLAGYMLAAGFFFLLRNKLPEASVWGYFLLAPQVWNEVEQGTVSFTAAHKTCRDFG